MQEYIDDLDRLLKSATHPRSTALLQKALEEARREGVANGNKEGGAGREVLPRPARTAYTTRISQYGKPTRLIEPLCACVCVCCVCVCVCVCVWCVLCVLSVLSVYV